MGLLGCWGLRGSLRGRRVRDQSTAGTRVGRGCFPGLTLHRSCKSRARLPAARKLPDSGNGHLLLCFPFGLPLSTPSAGLGAGQPRAHGCESRDGAMGQRGESVGSQPVQHRDSGVQAGWHWEAAGWAALGLHLPQRELCAPIPPHRPGRSCCTVLGSCLGALERRS